jgi:hypothetical protein
MNAKRLLTMRQRVVVLAIAALIAVLATYAPVVLDGTLATQLTTVAAACNNPSGGC